MMTWYLYHVMDDFSSAYYCLELVYFHSPQIDTATETPQATMLVHVLLPTITILGGQ